MIDPFVSGNPVSKSANINALDLRPTHIVLTHGHGDHLGDAIEIAGRTSAQIIATFELANYLTEKGCSNVADMGIGGSRRFPFGRLQFTIAHHSSSAPDGTYCGSPAGVLLFLENKVIYHAGDTALTYDMKLISETCDVDVAMVPIGDNYTMGVEDAARAVDFCGADVAIPIHYNTFPVIEADPDRFVDLLKADGKRGIILGAGETYEL